MRRLRKRRMMQRLMVQKKSKDQLVCYHRRFWMNHDAFDINIIHPKTMYLNGRPDWLLDDKKLEKYFINVADVEIENL